MRDHKNYNHIFSKKTVCYKIPTYLALCIRWRRQAVRVHNFLRHETSEGDIPGIPGAANPGEMSHLGWDDGLAEMAERIVYFCPEEGEGGKGSNRARGQDKEELDAKYRNAK